MIRAQQCARGKAEQCKKFMARTTTGNDVLRADVCFKVFHNSDCAQEQQRSQYARNRGQRRAGTAPRNSPEEKSSRSTPLEKPAARCPCSASWAQPAPPSAATHPQPLCQPHLHPPCIIREAQPGFQSDGSALGFGPLS